MQVAHHPVVRAVLGTLGAGWRSELPLPGQVPYLGMVVPGCTKVQYFFDMIPLFY